MLKANRQQKICKRAFCFAVFIMHGLACNTSNFNDCIFVYFHAFCIVDDVGRAIFGMTCNLMISRRLPIKQRYCPCILL